MHILYDYHRSIFSGNPHYLNQNGTIISRTQEDGLTIIIRKHNRDVDHRRLGD